jgi:hypothetical protein
VKDPKGAEFENVDEIDIVGVYASNAEAVKAWRGKAQSTVDDARMRYFVVHLHRLLQPDEDHEH